MKLCLRCNQYFEDATALCPTDSSPLEPVGDHPLIGALINDRYVVDSVIGKGSSGIVYKATRLLMQREVAVKVLHSYLGAESGALDRFLREARAASKLRHPHIINIWESGVTDDGQPYFVMDYLEGPTIAELLKEKGYLHAQRAMPIIRQICEALGEAHRQNIVHRDIKPENIVIEETDYAQAEDYVKVLDFGIADTPLDSVGRPRQRTAAGSPAYMSPEQCQGLQLDQRSDIYSLGIVVYEMFTGIRPFSADDVMKLFHMHVHMPPPSMGSVRPDLRFPAKFETVIATALAKKPDQRQQTIMEFWKDLEDSCRDFDSSPAAGPSKSADSLTLDSYSIPDTDRLVDGPSPPHNYSTASHNNNYTATTGSHNFLPAPEDMLQAELEAAELQLNRFRSTSVDLPAQEAPASLHSEPSERDLTDKAIEPSPPSAVSPLGDDERSAPQNLSFQASTRKNNGTSSGSTITPADDAASESSKTAAKAAEAGKDSVDRLLKSAKRASESFKTAMAGDQKNADKSDQDWSREILGRKAETPEPPAPIKVNPLSNPSGMGSNLDILDKLSAKSATEAEAEPSEAAPPLAADAQGVEMKTDTADIDVVSSGAELGSSEAALSESATKDVQSPKPWGQPQDAVPAAKDADAPAKMPAQEEVSAWARKVLGGAPKIAGAGTASGGSVVPLHSNDSSDVKSENRGRELERSKQIAEAADRLMGVLRKQPDSETPQTAASADSSTTAAGAAVDPYKYGGSAASAAFGMETGRFQSLGGSDIGAAEIAIPPVSAPGPTPPAKSAPPALPAKPANAPAAGGSAAGANAPANPAQRNLNASAAGAPVGSNSPLRQIANTTSNYAPGAGKNPPPGDVKPAHASTDAAPGVDSAKRAGDASQGSILGRRRFEDAVNRPVESSNPFASEVDKILDAAIIKTDDHPTVPSAVPGAKPAASNSVSGMSAQSSTPVNAAKDFNVPVVPPVGANKTVPLESPPSESIAKRFDPKRFEEPVNKKSEVLNPFASEVEKLLDSAIIKHPPGQHRPGDDSGKMNALGQRPVDLPPFKGGASKPPEPVGSAGGANFGAAARSQPGAGAPAGRIDPVVGDATPAPSGPSLPKEPVAEKNYSLADLDQIGRKPAGEPASAIPPAEIESPASIPWGDAGIQEESAVPSGKVDQSELDSIAVNPSVVPAFDAAALDAIGSPFDAKALDAIGSERVPSEEDAASNSSSGVNPVKHYSSNELNAIGGGKAFGEPQTGGQSGSDLKPVGEGLGAAGFGHEPSASAAAFVKSRSESSSDVSKLRGSFQKGRGVQEQPPKQQGGFAGALKSIFGGKKDKESSPVEVPAQKAVSEAPVKSKDEKIQQEKAKQDQLKREKELEKERLLKEKQEKEKWDKEIQEKEKLQKLAQEKEKLEKQGKQTPEKQTPGRPEPTAEEKPKAAGGKGFPFGGIFGGKKKEENDKKIQPAAASSFPSGGQPSWSPDDIPPGVIAAPATPDSLDGLAAPAPPTFISSFGGPPQGFGSDFGAPVTPPAEESQDLSSGLMSSEAFFGTDSSQSKNVSASSLSETPVSESALSEIPNSKTSVSDTPVSELPVSDKLSPPKTTFDEPPHIPDWTSSSAGISPYSDAADRPTGLGGLLSRMPEPEPEPPQSPVLSSPEAAKSEPSVKSGSSPSMAELFSKFSKNKKTGEQSTPDQTTSQTLKDTAALAGTAGADLENSYVSEFNPTPLPESAALSAPSFGDQSLAGSLSDFSQAPVETKQLDEPKTLPELEAEPFKFEPPPAAPELGVPRLPASYAAAAFEFEKPEPLAGQTNPFESLQPEPFAAGFAPPSGAIGSWPTPTAEPAPPTDALATPESKVAKLVDSWSRPESEVTKPTDSWSKPGPESVSTAFAEGARNDAPLVVRQELPLTAPPKPVPPALSPAPEKPSAAELARAFLARSNKPSSGADDALVTPPPPATPQSLPSDVDQAASAGSLGRLLSPEPPASGSVAPPAAHVPFAPPVVPSPSASAEAPATPPVESPTAKSLSELAARFDQPISERNKPAEATPASSTAKAAGEFDLKAELTERLNSILTPGAPKPLNKATKPSDAQPPKSPGAATPHLPASPPARNYETRELKLPEIKAPDAPRVIVPEPALPSPPATVQPVPLPSEPAVDLTPSTSAEAAVAAKPEPPAPAPASKPEVRPGADAMSRLIEAAKRVPVDSAQPSVPPSAPVAAAAPAPLPVPIPPPILTESPAPETAVGTGSNAGQSEALNKKIEAVKKKIAELKGGVDPTKPGSSSQVRLPGEATGSRSTPVVAQDSTSARNRMLEAAQRAVDTGTQSKMPAVKPGDRMTPQTVSSADFDPYRPAKIPNAPTPARMDGPPAATSNPKMPSRSEDAAALAAQLVSQAMKKKQQLQPAEDSDDADYAASFRNVEASVKNERARVGQVNQSARKTRARARASFNKPRFAPFFFFFVVIVGLVGGGYYYYENYYIHQAPAPVTVDQMITANKLVEARAALDKLSKTGKLTAKDADKYFKIAKKYADASKYDQAIDVLQKAFPRRSANAKKAQTVIKGYKLMKASE